MTNLNIDNINCVFPLTVCVCLTVFVQYDGITRTRAKQVIRNSFHAQR